MKKDRGITLIALVITIIVLLILAGVTIQTLTGDNGLITKANEAKIAAEDAKLEEEIQLAFVEYEADRHTNPEANLTNNLKSIFEKMYGTGNITVSKSGKNYKVNVKNSKTTYRVKYTGKVEKYEEMAVTENLYEYLDEESGILYLRATPKGNYLQVLSGHSSYNWPNVGKNYDKSKILKIIIEEPIAPNDCYSLFASLNKLTKIENIENLHTENFRSMDSMFSGCSSLEELDLSHFDTSKVTTMNQMFWGVKLENLDLSNFDTSKVRIFDRMFGYNDKITKLDLSGFDTSSATSMSGMFFWYTALKELNISNFDTSKVTDMQMMFVNCSSLTNLNLSNFNTLTVTSYDQMFTEVKARIILGENWNSEMTAQSTAYTGTQWNT